MSDTVFRPAETRSTSPAASSASSSAESSVSPILKGFESLLSHIGGSVFLTCLLGGVTAFTLVGLLTYAGLSEPAVIALSVCAVGSTAVLLSDRASLYLRLGQIDLAREALIGAAGRAMGTPEEARYLIRAAQCALYQRRPTELKTLLGRLSLCPSPDSPAFRTWRNVFEAFCAALHGDNAGARLFLDALAPDVECVRTLGLEAAVLDLDGRLVVAESMRLLGSGFLSEARAVLCQGLEDQQIPETRAAILNLRAWLELCLEGDLVAALEWANRALMLAPDLSAARHTRACIEVARGTPSDEDIAHVISVVDAPDAAANVSDPYSVYFAAQVLRDRGHHDRFSRAVELLGALPGGASLRSRLLQ